VDERTEKPVQGNTHPPVEVPPMRSKKSLGKRGRAEAPSSLATTDSIVLKMRSKIRSSARPRTPPPSVKHKRSAHVSPISGCSGMCA